MARAAKWREVNREIAYKKYSQAIERRDYKMPDGEIRDYYIRVEAPGVCVLAFTSDNEVITIPQYRPGPNAILRELPGGRPEEGETAVQAGVRELLEETGYAGEVEGWIGTWQADAYSQMDRSVIIVKNCQKVADQKLDTTEFGEVELVGISDFVTQVRAGKLTDTAGAMLALDHTGLLS